MDDIIRPKRPKLPGQPGTPAKKSVRNDVLDLRAQKPVKTEPRFKLPEEVADEDIAAAATGEAPDVETTVNESTEGKKRRFNVKLHMPHGKKQWIITVAIAVLLLGGGASGYWFVIRKPATPAPVAAKTVKKAAPVKPTTEISNLSGLTVPIGTNLEPVTSIQIENSPDARPQSGLKEASIVYEAIAEGGITRFNALFQDTAPDYVGPVRSLRPYYIDWFWPFDATIAHVGGAPQALADIKNLGIKDLDQFYNSGSYDRITSRYAPHNVYTSLDRLNKLEKNKGFTSVNFTGFTRKKESKAPTPTAKNIDLKISSFFYNVHYTFDPTVNAYLRSEGGEPHIDFKTNAQLAPKVVVAIVMGRGIASDGQHTEYTTVGSGQMYVFQDGKVQQGTWSKDSRQAQWKFTGTDSKPLAFNPGQVWFTMVDNAESVTYAP